MTIDEVRQGLAVIRKYKGDFEAQHSLEDILYHDVLKAIAEGAADPVELAKAALESTEIDFARHCA